MTASSVDHEKIHNPYLPAIVHISNIDDFLLYFYGVFPSFLKLDNAVPQNKVIHENV